MYDVFGKELLASKISQKLSDLKIKQFFYYGELEEIHTVYLKFDKWISLFFDDGVLFIDELQNLDDKSFKSEDNNICFNIANQNSYRYISDYVLNKNLLDFKITKEFSIELSFSNEHELLIRQEYLLEGEFGRNEILISK